MLELSFGTSLTLTLKIMSFYQLLVSFLVEIWSDKSLILRFIGLIFCLAALHGLWSKTGGCRGRRLGSDLGVL